MHIRFKRGLPLPHSGVPPQTPAVFRPVTEVGVSGRDYLGLRPQFRVDVGDQVKAGQAVVADRRNPQVVITVPVSGQVTKARRRHPTTGAFLLSIAVDSVEQYSCDITRDWRNRTAVKESLLRSGLWPALRQRPFGVVADPASDPSAILVCGTAADGFAPDPAPIIEGSRKDFDTGVEALQFLTDGPVLISHAAGRKLAEGATTIDGPFPAGLAGAQIHALHPVNGGRVIWWVNYQETIAIGRLLNSGQVNAERTIAIAGPGIERAQLLKVPPGASIADLVQDLVEEDSAEVRSGPVLAGRRDQYLGRHDLQISVRKSRAPRPAWLSFFTKMIGPASEFSKPIIPIAAHEESFPFNIPVVPLLRALAIGDTKSAARMGCLDLIEEDVAVLSHICPSRNNYQKLLRTALDEIRRGV